MLKYCSNFKPQYVIVKKQYIYPVSNVVRRVVDIGSIYNAIYTQIPVSERNKNAGDCAQAVWAFNVSDHSWRFTV